MGIGLWVAPIVCTFITFVARASGTFTMTITTANMNSMAIYKMSGGSVRTPINATLTGVFQFS